MCVFDIETGSQMFLSLERIFIYTKDKVRMVYL